MAVAAIVVGIVLAAAAVLRIEHDRVGPVAFGDPASVGLAASRPVAPTESRATKVAADATASASRTFSATSPVAPGRPALLSIPRIHATARVEPVLASHAILDVPDDISRIGWWSASTLVGASSGSTVFDGHVDSVRDGLGVLADLARLRSGDIISVTTDRGDRIDYRVYSLAVYVKAGGLPAKLFASTGPARLVLISCGGPFNHQTHQYADNVVVFAAPV